jgi:antitoxin PrlF
MSRRRMTRKGQVTLPKKVREELRLAVGDAVEFEFSANGEFVLRKAQAPTTKLAPTRRDTQLHRRAAELRSLLRGLD